MSLASPADSSRSARRHSRRRRGRQAADRPHTSRAVTTVSPSARASPFPACSRGSPSTRLTGPRRRPARRMSSRSVRLNTRAATGAAAGSASSARNARALLARSTSAVPKTSGPLSGPTTTSRTSVSTTRDAASSIDICTRRRPGAASNTACGGSPPGSATRRAGRTDRALEYQRSVGRRRLQRDAHRRQRAASIAGNSGSWFPDEADARLAGLAP